MIRNISLLFLASTLFFTSIKAFDQDELDKTAELLTHKKIIIELIEKVDPIKYAQKKEKYDERKEIDAQQYLEKKYSKSLVRYEKSRNDIAKWFMYELFVIGACIFLRGLIDGGLYYNNMKLMCWEETGALIASVFVSRNYLYLKHNPPADTERKKETFLKILDNKIDKVKARLKAVKEVLQ